MIRAIRGSSTWKRKKRVEETFIKVPLRFIIRDSISNLFYRGIRSMLSVGVRALSSYERFPVSLKIDTSSDFYRELFEPKKTSRDLSEFIVMSMQAYYENPQIRELVDEHILNNSPDAELRRQLERIRLEHSKTVMTTSILGQHVSQTKSFAEQGVAFAEQAMQSAMQSAGFGSTGESPIQEQTPQTTPEMQGFSQRLEQVEKVLPDITDKLSQILMVMTSAPAMQQVQQTYQHGSVQQQPVLQPHANPYTPQPQLHTDVANPYTETVQPTVQPSYSPTQPVVNPAPNVPQANPNSTNEPIVVDFSGFQAGGDSEPIVLGEDSSEPTISIGGEEKPAEAPTGKPSSFGKLASSIKKR